MTIYWTEERRSGGELLAAALEREGLHVPILRTAAGKPYLAGGPFVSVTHTEGLSAVAVSPRPVGIDAEAKREISAALIARLTEGERREDFFRLWTAKEAYIKLRGDRLSLLPALVFEKNVLYLRGVPLSLALSFYDLAGRTLCICTEGEEMPVFRPLA